MVREVAAVNSSTETEALQLIESQLAKSPRRAAKAAEAEVEAEAEADADADVEDQDEAA